MTHSIVSLALLITLASGSTSLAHPHEAQSPADFATQLSAAFQNAAENIKPSVVRIGTAEVVPHTTGYHWRTGVPFIEGTGSGLIISADGYIATNDHVVADADIILVTLHDGRQFEAEAVGRDRQSDLAVIRIEASDLTPATFADPATTHVGQWVLAVGSPFGLS
ncbi:MAG TPA: trypsin-like peptidase domain-containing protein, partial [Phycisphaerales bacterium]|nr:trypsin-like peptidase domain-containing protein [Phycisphaerales bacterium]